MAAEVPGRPGGAGAGVGAAKPAKAPDALRTISELAEDLGIAAHILRFWETRFPQLKPLQRAGQRRYYRPADVALARALHQLLHGEGYTVKGVQKLLAAEGVAGLLARTGVRPSGDTGYRPSTGDVAERRSAADVRPAEVAVGLAAGAVLSPIDPALLARLKGARHALAEALGRP